MRPKLLFACSIVLTALVALSGTGVGQAGYAVSVSPAVDTPNRDVAFDGRTYEVSRLGRVEPGGSVSATVSAPSGDAYDVYLYDADRDILDRHRDPASATVSFDVPDDDPAYAPGTYVVAVDHDGEFTAVAPVVIAGYRVSVDAPASAEAGSSVTVEASLTTIDDSEPVDRVRVVIGDDVDDQRVTLSPSGGGDYAATFTLDDFEGGDYSLYVVVQGSAQVLGRQEVLGVSDAGTLSVESAETETSSDGSSGSSDGDSSDGGAGGGGAGGSATAATTTAGPTETPRPTTSAGTTDRPPTTSDDSETTADVATTTDDPVITPNPTTTAAPGTTATPGQPLGALPPLLALALVALAARRRR